MFLDRERFRELRTIHNKPNAITIEALWSNLEHLYTIIDQLFDSRRDHMAIEKINSKQFAHIISRIRKLEAQLNKQDNDS